MKIGIVTQPLGHNIGGILQNWALQEFLRQNGHEPVTLNYVDTVVNSTRSLLRIPLRNIRTFIRRLYGRYDRYMKFSDLRPLPENIKFIDNNISATERSNSYTPLIDAEAYIVGSDQVWRPRYNKLTLSDQFLKFISDNKVLRLSYAASFGTDKWEYTPEQTTECASLIKRFDAVSVREESGVALCREYLGVEASVVTDPTLLLVQADYDSLCDYEGLSTQPYVATYFLDVNSHKRSIAKAVSKSKGTGLLDLHPQRTPLGRWLAGICKSKAVITDSFHGTVFAIIFHRNFAVIANARRGNSRLVSLLGKLGLEDHLVDTSEEAVKVCGNQPDWAEVDRRLKILRSQSSEFLTDILNGK